MPFVVFAVGVAIATVKYLFICLLSLRQIAVVFYILGRLTVGLRFMSKFAWWQPIKS